MIDRQIVLLIPSIALLYPDNKLLDPIFKICLDVGHNHSVSRSSHHDHCQVPSCIAFGVGFDVPTNADSALLDDPAQKFQQMV
jgi:hypothetical protein